MILPSALESTLGPFAWPATIMAFMIGVWIWAWILPLAPDQLPR